MRKKVFITKYAFSTGIIECEADIRMETKSCFGKPVGFDFYTEFYGTDFHLTKEAAVKECEKRKEKKIVRLEKQLLKMQKKTF
jgi:hypothetical protein